MKFKYTHIEDSQLPLLEDVKSLFLSGVDAKGNHMTVKDALNLPNSSSIVRRAIEEVVLKPIQPNLIGARLVTLSLIHI